MKKLVVLIISICFIFSLSSCAENPKSGVYEAYLTIDSAGDEEYGAIFCIIDAEVESGQWFINKIYLPFDKTCTEISTSNNDVRNNELSVFLGWDGVSADIMLNTRHPADEKSEKKLKNSRIVNHGWISALITDTVYHYSGCPIYNDETVPHDQKIYFNTSEEARAFGYEPCPRCGALYE